MNIKKYVLYTLFAGLACSSFSGPLSAMEGDATDITKISEEVSNSWLYEKTLGEHPGAILIGAVVLFGTHVTHQKYKQWHKTRAKIRRQLWHKIQRECYDFTKHGNSKFAQVRDITNPNIANALLTKKADWLQDTQSIYSWGLFQDTRLTNLVEEFFTALKKKSSNVQEELADTTPWWNFWSPEGGERLLEDILRDIEECLMGSCG